MLNETIAKANVILGQDFDENRVSDVTGYLDSVNALSEDVKKYDEDIFDLLAEEEEIRTDGLEAQE